MSYITQVQNKLTDTQLQPICNRFNDKKKLPEFIFLEYNFAK